jgi:protein SCO1/2
MKVPADGETPAAPARRLPRLPFVIAGLGFLLSFTILVWAIQLRNTVVRNAAATELPRLAAVPPFDVVSEQGTPVTRASYAGKVWIADFIFTSCGGICPVMTSRMKALAAELKDEPDVRFVSFSVDPERDTVEALARYGKEAGADPSRWSFLRTDGNRIRALAREGFKLPVEDADPYAGEPILHSSRFVLVDAEGTIRGWYDSEDAGKRNLLVKDARRLAADAAAKR